MEKSQARYQQGIENLPNAMRVIVANEGEGEIVKDKKYEKFFFVRLKVDDGLV